MKKIFSFFAAVLFAGSMMAGTVTLTNENIVAAGKAVSGYQDWKVTDGASRTWNAHAIKNTHSAATAANHFLQIKKGSSSEAYYIQIPNLGENIQSITMTVSSTSKPMEGGGNTNTVYFSASNSTSAAGVGVVSGKDASSITIDASELALQTGYITAGGAVRIWNITVTTAAAPAVAKPTFTPVAEVFEGNLNVKIACTTDGAAIYYTSDGTEPSASSTLYTAAGIDISNTTTIKAIAIKGEEKSAVATKTYTKVVPVSLTDFLTNKPTSEVILKDLTVIYATGKNTYVIDEDGVALVMYDASKTYYDGTLTAGKVLSGQKATYNAYNNQDQIVPTNKVVATDGVAPVPTLMNVAPTADQVNKYISFKNVAAALNTTDSKYYIFDGAIQLYSASTTLKPEADGNYDLAGILINYKGTQLELIVTSLKKSTPTAIDNTEAGVKANKVLRDGVLLIEKNGVLYNAQGAVVR